MTTVDTSSATSILAQALDSYGLGALGQQVWDWQQQGLSTDQIYLQLKDTPQYKARFPAMATLAQKGQAISEAQYINLEQTYTQLGRQFGLPATFYDQPDDFAALIGGEVSPSEFSSRLQGYQQMAFDTDPTARAELKRLYGVDEGDIASFFIDPDRSLPIITQKANAAEVAAQSQKSGYGALTDLEAERLSFLSNTDAAAGFQKLVPLKEVLGQLPGEDTPGVSREDALAATFQGDAAAQQGIERRQAQRVSPFQSGGTYTTAQQGIAGVG